MSRIEVLEAGGCTYNKRKQKQSRKRCPEIDRGNYLSSWFHFHLQLLLCAKNHVSSR